MLSYNKLLTNDSKWYNIVTSLLINKWANKINITKKEINKMVNRKIKTNTIKALKVSAIAVSLGGGVYFGIPSLNWREVVSLACLSVGFYLVVRFISK